MSTSIDNLPNLDDLERADSNMRPYNIQQTSPNYLGAQFLDREHATKVDKFVRPPYTLNPSSGMVDNGYLGGSEITDDFFEIPPKKEEPQMFIPQPSTRNYAELTCIDFANHFHTCPICSKFYKNDKTVYIIVIIVLLLVCLILLKKILD